MPVISILENIHTLTTCFIFIHLRTGRLKNLFSAQGEGYFLHRHVRAASRIHPASYTVGARECSLGVEWPWRDAIYLLPSSVEVCEKFTYASKKD
jgi:hypothetical protein